MYRAFFKRFLDLTLSLIAFIILLPVTVTLTIILFAVNGGKPFFFQLRPGKKEKIFRLVKFRTMNEKKDETGELLPDFKRTTKFGGFMRKTSLDELPQLINVIMGDMSLVGPRPLLVEYLIHYNTTQRQRHTVRPGITGWAQVNGRNTIDWQQKFEYDVWYVEHLSFGLDCRILWMSVLKAFTGKDINSSEQQTMEKFSGN